MPLGKYLTLRAAIDECCILEVEDGYAESGAALILCRQHGTGETPPDEQLWWQDRITHSIRSKLNNYCLTADKDGKIVIHNYQPTNHRQRWLLVGRSIMSRNGESVVGVEKESLVGAHVFSQEREDRPSQEWVREHTDAHILHIRNCSTNKVLDVAWESREAGAGVIVYNMWPDVKNNQLWYEDENGVIRSKLNDFALTSSGVNMTLQPYKEGNKNQQWLVSQGAIVNRHDRDLVLDIKEPPSLLKKFKTTQVVSVNYNGNASQRWEFLYSDHNEITFGSPRSHLLHICHQNTGFYLTATPLRSLGIPSDRVDATLSRLDPSNPLDQQWSIDKKENNIKSAADGRVLDLSGKEAVFSEADERSPNQRWRMVAMTIQCMSNQADCYLGTSESQQEGLEGLIRLVARPVTKQQMPDLWKATKAPVRYFFIESKHCDCVLDVKGGDAESGGEVIIFPAKDGQDDNQLWYEDELQHIRSKLNNYLMDSHNGKVCMRPYQLNSTEQQWMISGDVIRNRAQSDLVLDINGGSTKPITNLIPYKIHGGTNQRWTFKYI